MAFVAFDVAVELVGSVREVIGRVGQRDPDLARQIRRAASSVALNVAEGNRRAGRDRRYAFRVAAGSADEVRAALRVAEAWGYLDGASIAAPLALADRVCALLWRLTEATSPPSSPPSRPAAR